MTRPALFLVGVGGAVTARDRHRLALLATGLLLGAWSWLLLAALEGWIR